MDKYSKWASAHCSKKQAVKTAWNNVKIFATHSFYNIAIIIEYAQITKIFQNTFSFELLSNFFDKI